MRIKPQHLVWIIVALVLGPVLLYVINSDAPGKKSQSGDVITRTVGSATASASSKFTVQLKEGGDAAHESEHIFEALTNPAIASASFDVKSLALEVRYDGSRMKEADLRQLLATAGYLAPTIADAVPATPSADGKSQEHKLTLSDKIDPALISAKAGVPLRLVFSQGTAHLASISIAEYGVKQDLSKGGATVQIAAPKPGTYKILCAEGFADATLLVE